MTNVVHVVDDDEAFRTAISRLLRAAGYQVAVYESAHQFLDRLPSNEGENCILLDVQIPDFDGPSLQRRLAELDSGLPIVFLTGHGDIPTSVDAIRAGAEDFLTKPVDKERLIEAIDRALTRARMALDRRLRYDSLVSLIANLTPREREVFELVVRGRMNKQIAFELGTTERTIKAHRHNVMGKIGVRSVAELVSIAERLSSPRDP